MAEQRKEAAGGVRCDCGYALTARTEQRRLAEVRRHALEAHGISFSAEEALAVLVRFELDVDEGKPARLAIVDVMAGGKEQA